MDGWKALDEALAGRLGWDEAAVTFASAHAWQRDRAPAHRTGRDVLDHQRRHRGSHDVRPPRDHHERHHPGVLERHRPEAPARRLDLHALDVASADGEHRWQQLYDAVWPAYRAWFRRPVGLPRPDLDGARRLLLRHLPELVPTWERLSGLAGGDDDTARMLAMYNPPPFLAGCSQASVGTSQPGLLRNYDYDENLFEGVVMGSRFDGRRVVGTSDQLWGLLDGMNDAGLAISLTFGGRRAVGPGFGIPIVLRYIVQTCATLGEARAALARIPVQMSYNILVVDRDGRAFTAYVNPDRPAEFSDLTASTNHQRRVEWPEHDRLTASTARARRLESVLSRPEHPDRTAHVLDAFLHAPLRSTNYRSGIGTLYTVHYQPDQAKVTYHWPRSTWSHSLDDVVSGTHAAALTTQDDERR